VAIPWKDVINGIEAEDLPENGKPAPVLENIKGLVRLKNLTVQKLVTEVYIYTDMDNEVQGEVTFQSATLFGKMTVKEFNELIKEARRNRAKDA
jgi:hypothetical protein